MTLHGNATCLVRISSHLWASLVLWYGRGTSRAQRPVMRSQISYIHLGAAGTSAPEPTFCLASCFTQLATNFDVVDFFGHHATVSTTPHASFTLTGCPRFHLQCTQVLAPHPKKHLNVAEREAKKKKPQLQHHAPLERTLGNKKHDLSTSTPHNMDTPEEGH